MKTSNQKSYLTGYIIEFYNASRLQLKLGHLSPTVLAVTAIYMSFFVDRGKCIEFSPVPCPQGAKFEKLVHVKIHEHLTERQPILPMQQVILHHDGIYNDGYHFIYC